MKKMKSKLLVKILAIILCVLMVTSMAFYTIYMIVENVKDANKEEESHDGHEHAASPVEYTFTL